MKQVEWRPLSLIKISSSVRSTVCVISLALQSPPHTQVLITNRDPAEQDTKTYAFQLNPGTPKKWESGEKSGEKIIITETKSPLSYPISATMQ